MPLRPDNITDRFNKLSAAAGVRVLGPHQVRHMLAWSRQRATQAIRRTERCR